MPNEPPRECENCGKEYNPVYDDCPNCGTGFFMPPVSDHPACDDCGAPFDRDHYKCPNCGTAIIPPA